MDAEQMDNLDKDLVLPEIDEQGEQDFDTSTNAIQQINKLDEGGESCEAKEEDINLEHAKQLQDLLQSQFNYPQHELPLEDLLYMQNLPGSFGWGVIRITTDQILGCVAATLIEGEIVGALNEAVLEELNSSHLGYLAKHLAAFMPAITSHEYFSDEKFTPLKEVLLEERFWLDQLKMATSCALYEGSKMPPPR